MPRRNKKKYDLKAEDVIAQNRAREEQELQQREQEAQQMEEELLTENKQDIYDYASRDEKIDYLKQLMWSKVLPSVGENGERFKEELEKPETRETLGLVADRVKNIRVAAELMESKDLQRTIFGGLVPGKKGWDKAKEDFIQNKLNGIENYGTESAYRKVLAEREAKERLWRQKLDEFAFTQEDYENATPKERAAKATEYIKLYYSKDAADPKAMDEKLKDPVAQEVILKTVTDCKLWHTVVDMTGHGSFVDATLGSSYNANFDDAQREQSKEDFLEYNLKAAVQYDEKAGLEARAKEKADKQKEEEQKRVEDADSRKREHAAIDVEFYDDHGRNFEKWQKWIEGVDFNMAGTGSRTFKQMKEAIVDLNKFHKEMRFNFREGYDLQQQEALMDKQKAAMKAVEKYLAYKQKQMDNEPERRNNPKKQKREQPRIATSIRILKEMEDTFAVEQDVTFRKERHLRDELYDKIMEEDKILKNHNTPQKEYLASVARTVDMINNFDAKRWYKSNEHASDFLEIHDKEVHKDYNPDVMRELLGARTASGMKVYNEAYNMTMNDPDKRLHVNDLINMSHEMRGFEFHHPFPNVKQAMALEHEKDDYIRNLLSADSKNQLNRHDLFKNEDSQIMERMNAQAERQQQQNRSHNRSQNRSHNRMM
ncbi:MAG: hypothetical protein K6E84_00435 [Lachnospiraceae bacterium]|nr:hypothetical protein [Lachnospiraceae bacterium]